MGTAWVSRHQLHAHHSALYGTSLAQQPRQGCATFRALDAAPAGKHFDLIIAPRPEKEGLFWLSAKQRRCYRATADTTQLFLEAPETPGPRCPFQSQPCPCI